MCSASAMAQVAAKFDKAAILKKIERSNNDIADPKKNVKGATWMQRGDIFYEAAAAPTKGLYGTMDVATLTLMFGQPASTETKVINGVAYDVLSYANFDVYVANNAVVFWTSKVQVIDNPLAEAYSAYAKAAELDKKQESKAGSGITSVANLYKEKASNLYSLNEHTAAAADFKAAYEIQTVPFVNKIDTISLFYAGLLYTIGGDFENAAPLLEKAKEYGHLDEGNTYYYLGFSKTHLGEYDDAKTVLFEGLKQYPENNNIVEGLIFLYERSGEEPADLVEIIKGSISEDPDNVRLWSGLGRIYDKLDDIDGAIVAFNKAVELAPQDFANNFNLGLYYLKNAEKIDLENGSIPFTNAAAVEAARERVLNEYRLSIPYLEKAHQINPTAYDPVNLLKNVTFRLRDDESMMKKYEQYNELLKQFPQS